MALKSNMMEPLKAQVGFFFGGYYYYSPRPDYNFLNIELETIRRCVWW